MSTGSPRALAQMARQHLLDALLREMPALVSVCLNGARTLAGQVCEPAMSMRRRDLVLDLTALEASWRTHFQQALSKAQHDLTASRSWLGGIKDALAPASQPGMPLSLIEDSDIERDLTIARLAQALSHLAASEFTDLNARLQSIEGAVDALRPHKDVLSVHWVAKTVVGAWLETGLGLDHWQTLQSVLHEESGLWLAEAYHRVNEALLAQGLRPEIDLRPFIRRAKDGATTTEPSAPPPKPQAVTPRQDAQNSGLQPMGQAYEETRLMTQSPGLLYRSPAQSQALLSKLSQVVARQVPEFQATEVLSNVANGQVVPVSPGLGQAMQAVEGAVRAASDAQSPAEALQALQQSKVALKQSASSPIERATIEIVALLFQAILTEDRLPAPIRVWFARLQMPVLRVAVGEPDFFASTTHPARVLIDRMGACVMGFAGGDESKEDALYAEIRRIVQVIEAYPDTGRRVFQTVLAEFVKFLETYFRDDHAASRKGVSLAQQVEQRETCAIQYTIELRNMLDGVPVHEGVRDFLFKVWADVLAHSAVRSDAHSDETKALQRAAADLIWSASAKTSREERAEVLRRLPPLLKTIKEGMARAGLPAAQQDEHIKALNAALAAAFAAKSASLSAQHMQDLTQRLEALGDVLPDLDGIELDADLFRDISGYENDDLEVVSQGGSMPTPAMLAWAKELQLGAWFNLDYRHRQERVQLAWHGLQKQLALFVTVSGRGVLFQQQRLAAFLQAGLLTPLEEESLTTRATRAALAKLDADPARLLN